MPTSTPRPPAPPRESARPRARRDLTGAVKHASYTVDSCRRVLFTITIDGVARLIDTPAELYETAASGLATPDRFIVEPHLDANAPEELQAIVNEYLEQAAAHARVPMTFSKLGTLLESLTR